ncbi:MAG TPA: hypothetical protein VF899_18855 [Pyrinomonadaceae bacterium]
MRLGDKTAKRPVAYTAAQIKSSSVNGHGAGPDGSGRRVINIYIDSSWDVSPGQTDPNIWNAVNSAANKWNQATDQYGNKTAFYFQVNQGGGTGQADYIIQKGTLSGSTAATDIFHYPYTVTLDYHLPVFKKQSESSERSGNSLLGWRGRRPVQLQLSMRRTAVLYKWHGSELFGNFIPPAIAAYGDWSQWL